MPRNKNVLPFTKLKSDGSTPSDRTTSNAAKFILGKLKEHDDLLNEIVRELRTIKMVIEFSQDVELVPEE